MDTVKSDRTHNYKSGSVFTIWLLFFFFILSSLLTHTHTYTHYGLTYGWRDTNGEWKRESARAAIINRGADLCALLTQLKQISSFFPTQRPASLREETPSPSIAGPVSWFNPPLHPIESYTPYIEEEEEEEENILSTFHRHIGPTSTAMSTSGSMDDLSAIVTRLSKVKRSSLYV